MRGKNEEEFFGVGGCHTTRKREIGFLRFGKGSRRLELLV